VPLTRDYIAAWEQAHPLPRPVAPLQELLPAAFGSGPPGSRPADHIVIAEPILSPGAASSPSEMPKKDVAAELT